jgi:hypothetical protein
VYTPTKESTNDVLGNHQDSDWESFCKVAGKVATGFFNNAEGEQVVISVISFTKLTRIESHYQPELIYSKMFSLKSAK